MRKLLVVRPVRLGPREGLELVLMKMGRAGPPLSHAAGRRQASLGTPILRTPTVAPGPTACPDLDEKRGERASAKRHGP